MYRIDNADATSTLPTPLAPGPVPNGFFQSGNPAIGQKATTVDRDWANATQEEICAVIEAAGITLSKTDHTQLLQALESLRWAQHSAAFGAPGPFTFTVPPNVTVLDIEMWPGGGAGGAAVGSNQAGSGGGGGTWAHLLLAVTPGAVINGSVGAGGVGNATGTGGNGGASSFGPLSVAGGTGGSADQGPAGVGGGATGEDFAIDGGNGTDGFLATATFTIGGAGGDAPRGGQGAIMNANAGAGAAGNIGQSPGGGGGGGNSGPTASAAGGDGAAGLVMVRW